MFAEQSECNETNRIIWEADTGAALIKKIHKLSHVISLKRETKALWQTFDIVLPTNVVFFYFERVLILCGESLLKQARHIELTVFFLKTSSTTFQKLVSVTGWCSLFFSGTIYLNRICWPLKIDFLLVFCCTTSSQCWGGTAQACTTLMTDF